MSALLEFQCSRHPRGYRIAAFDQRRLSKGWIIDDNRIVEPPPNATEDERLAAKLWDYDLVIEKPARIIYWLKPLSPEIEYFDLFEDAPGMFLEFANSPRSPEGVKAFANRYGTLDGANLNWTEHWYDEIRMIRRAVRAWERAKITGDFNKIIRIVHERSMATGSGEKGTWAKIFLAKDRKTADARLCIRPDDPIDAMWVQLTLAIAGNMNLRRCTECRTWFPISSGENRSDKEYCSDACRMRAYRKRKAARKRGKSPVGGAQS